MPIEMTFTGARWLSPEGLRDDPLSVADGVVTESAGRTVDLSGKLILPGIVDLHGDGFERHLAPRRGAMTNLAAGLISAEAELAANGITTAVLAQFYSWEGGLRSPDFATRMLEALARMRAQIDTDLQVQLRLETHMIDDFPAVLDLIARHDIRYVAFNDHLPHDRLAACRSIPRLTGTALKSGRSPEAHLALMQALHARSAEVPAALDALCATLTARGIRYASHDDATPDDRATWAARGALISEFPETREAALAAHQSGQPVVLGAPNVVRGASHKGKVSARALVEEGLCAALASDYHYPAPRNAVWELVDLGLLDLAAAWALISSGPAEVLGLTDRGSLAPGLRADLLILDAETRRVEATLSGGTFTYLAADTARRLTAA
ncbi:alpha-D-ribose 1-methylphosphonate 5-triphosphate diphosphatase [Marinovum sp.]|uniref:alpha-D-ribose 1-methylphosphonate 5-triphosphate diphosphatase n=1 Tax=Marinovum sp. TaxID=2024839 RepID=UPI003A9517D8